MFYFAYGSNLNRLQMKRRCRDSKAVEKVSIEGYRLVFNGVADIIEEEGCCVHGAVYEVTDKDIINLDIYEGVPRLYKKVCVKVKGDSGKEYEAFVYAMVSKGIGIPTESYYSIIKEGYKDWNIELIALESARKESMDEHIKMLNESAKNRYLYRYKTS